MTNLRPTSARTAGQRPFAHRRAASFAPVIGCDEVGRGALCGPVVVAAVWFEPGCLPKGVLGRLDDSKKLTRAEREALYPALLGCARVAFAARSARAIDRFGIRTMTLEAMTHAVSRLSIDAPVRIDGVDVPRGLAGPNVEAVVRGDGKVPQIAAASILAKVLRDRMMARLAMRHPAYLWERNSGYGTAAHREAIVRIGATRHHRRSFGDLFSNLSDGTERLVAQAAPDAQGLDGFRDIVDAEQLDALRRA